MIESARFGVEYQPIVSTGSGETWGYEALARFYLHDGRPVAPPLVFEALHGDPAELKRVELALKKLQLQLAPSSAKLFVNLDLHTITEGDAADPLIALVSSEPNTVVELIENADIHDAKATERLQNVLSAQGVETALDDLGAAHSLLSLEVLIRVDYCKFDRRWISLVEQEPYRRVFSLLLDYARQTGKPTVLEGIESTEALTTARLSGIDYVQGYLYRPDFVAFGPCGESLCPKQLLAKV